MGETAEKFAPMFRHVYATLGALSKAFYERYGAEALPIIAEVAANSGVGSAKIIQRTSSVKSMNDIGEIFKMWKKMGFESEIIELSDDTMRLRTSKCPLGLEGTTRELCEALMTSDSKMMSTLLKQEVEAKILKSVAAGDENCEIEFTTK